MSILNVWVAPDQALVGVDTECVDRIDGKPGQVGQVSKMLALPHINAVLGARGYSLFFAIAFNKYLLNVGTFDELMERTPQILKLAFNEFIQASQTCGCVDDQHYPLDRQEIVFVGWSTKLNRPIGYEFRQDNRAVGFLSRPIDPYFISPSTQLPQLPCYPDTMSNMIRVALIQQRVLRELAPDCAAGGHFVIAKICRERMLITQATTLPPKRAALDHLAPFVVRPAGLHA